MAKRPRRNHGAVFKAKMALEAIKGDKTLVELSERFQVYHNQITEWKKQLLEKAPERSGRCSTGNGITGYCFLDEGYVRNAVEPLWSPIATHRVVFWVAISTVK